MSATFATSEPVFLESPGYHTAGGQRYTPILDECGDVIALVLSDEGDKDCERNVALFTNAADMRDMLRGIEMEVPTDYDRLQCYGVMMSGGEIADYHDLMARLRTE